MTDRSARLAIAERIAEAENRISQLRERIERLKTEGSDTWQASEALRLVSSELANLYHEQSMMRRSAWAQKYHDRIPRHSHHQVRASVH
jgi:two-component sensor histidine kinase